MSNSTNCSKKKSKPRKRINARIGEPVETPHPHDILCGRGGQANYHIGNLNYRALVDLNKSLYSVCQKKHKQLISKSIVATIARQDPPGRFLEQDGKSGLWYEIEEKWAVRKTSQAFREEQMEDSLTILGLDESSMSLSLGTSQSSELSSISTAPKGDVGDGSPKQLSSENCGSETNRTTSRRRILPKGNAGEPKKQQTKKRSRAVAAGKKTTAQKKRKVKAVNKTSTPLTLKSKETIEVDLSEERTTPSSQLGSPNGEVCWHQVFTCEVQEYICSVESNPRQKNKAPVRVSLEDIFDPSVSVLELGQWLDGVEFDGSGAGLGSLASTKAAVVCNCETPQSECAICNDYTLQPICSNPSNSTVNWDDNFNEVSDEDSFAPLI